MNREGHPKSPWTVLVHRYPADSPGEVRAGLALLASASDRIVSVLLSWKTSTEIIQGPTC